MTDDNIFVRYTSSLGITLLLIITTVFTSCDVVNVDGEKGKGQINISMSEASSSEFLASAVSGDAKPQDSTDGLEEVNIDILELKVLYFENQADTASVDTSDVEHDEGDGKWVTLPITPHKLNLLELSNSDTLLAEAELEDGYYSEMRMVLGEDNDVVVNGETHALKVPSGQQSGYKLKLGEPLQSGEVVNLTITFDAEKSVKQTGNGKYMLQPVLHVFKGQPVDS